MNLIDPSTIDTLNRAHRNVAADIRDADIVPTVREAYERDVLRKQTAVYKALSDLGDTYLALRVLGSQGRRNADLESLLDDSGIQTQ